MNMAEKLNTLRREHGDTQSALAEKLGVSRQAISLWELGDAVPSMDNLKRLSELYGVSVDYLVSDGGENCAAVTVAEKPEEKAPGKGAWRKPALIGVAIGLAIAALIALFVLTYHAGYDKGVEDATPTYPVHTDILDPADFEEPGDLYW